jgi:ATP-binding cassette subfamily B protein
MDLRLILGFAWPWRGTLALCALLMLAETGVALAVPWLAGQFAGQLLTGLAQAGGLLLVALLVLFAVQALLKFANSWLLGRTAEYILADLRTQLYDHLQALPLAYFQQRRHGEILALLTNDVARLASYISGTLLSVVPLVLTVAGAALMMLRIDARLTLIVVLMIPLFYMLLKVLGRRLRPLSSQLQQAHADSVAIAEENLSMLPAIKTFTREPLESARYRGKIESILHLSNQERLIYAALGPGVQFLAAAGMVLILWQLSGPMAGRSPAEIVSFLLYATLLTRPVSALADVYGQTRQAHGALERLSAVLAEHPEAATNGQSDTARCARRDRVPGGPFCLPRSSCHTGRRRPSHSRWRNRCLDRAQRRGQKHPGASADAADGAGQRPHPDRRRRHCQPHADQPAQPDRRGAAACVAVQRQRV